VITRDPLAITRPVEPSKPFTVAGEQGAILGEQGGVFEYWLWPVKVLSDFRITAEPADYPVPINVSAHASEVEVAPAMTTITCSRASSLLAESGGAIDFGRVAGGDRGADYAGCNQGQRRRREQARVPRVDSVG
jgi:hypothetical protein